MKTSIYVKMDAPEPVLLSEGVCRQLGDADIEREPWFRTHYELSTCYTFRLTRWVKNFVGGKISWLMG